MTYPTSHAMEVLRLQALHQYDILDSPPEQAYDHLTAMAAQFCKAPIALVSFIDNKRQWFKSHHGLEVSETPKAYAFCAHAINHLDDIFIVPDARKDPRFINNPFVTGDPKVVFYAGVPLRDDDNIPLGTLCIIDYKPRTIAQDQINSLKTLSKQVMHLLKSRKLKNELIRSVMNLSHKNRNLEQFASIAAHDLKSPLINISSIAEYLSESYGPILEADGKSMLSLIQRASKKLEGLIDDILEYSRNEKILHEAQSVIDLQKLRNELYELFIHEPAFKLRLKTPLKNITSNRVALHQIFVNLISNAIRYNDKESVLVEIGIAENEKFIEIYVLDNGPGIASQFQEKAFEQFNILSTVDKNGVRGSGIGLSIVKQLVEGLGGTIKLTSELGKGCRFAFKINKNTSCSTKVNSFKNMLN